jgi:hypothetical protein
MSAIGQARWVPIGSASLRVALSSSFSVSGRRAMSWRPPTLSASAKPAARKLVTVEGRVGKQVMDLPTVKRVVMAMLLAPGARFDFRIVDHAEGFPSWVAETAGLADRPCPLVAR